VAGAVAGKTVFGDASASYDAKCIFQRPGSIVMTKKNINSNYYF
jgi:hypothetical protein